MKSQSKPHYISFRSSEIRPRLDSLPHPSGPIPQASLAAQRVPPSASRPGHDSSMRRRRLRDPGEPSDILSPPQPPVKNTDFDTISELLELRSQHVETGFVNHPVHTTSTLDLSGWRFRWCLKNFEKMVSPLLFIPTFCFRASILALSNTPFWTSFYHDNGTRSVLLMVQRAK